MEDSPDINKNPGDMTTEQGRGPTNAPGGSGKPEGPEDSDGRSNRDKIYGTEDHPHKRLPRNIQPGGTYYIS
jgi:hypothetical protein